MHNPYWDNITKIAEKQREKGINVYGQGLEDNIAPDIIERINYIEEELIDSLMYLEWLKEAMPKKTRLNYFLECFPKARVEGVLSNVCAGDVFDVKCPFLDDKETTAEICERCWSEEI